MTNLPQNPTKDELTQKYWYEFLQFLKGKSNSIMPQSFVEMALTKDFETAFWAWVIDHKISSSANEASKGGEDAGTANG